MTFIVRFLTNLLIIISGGVTTFATNESTVAKWVMNRSFQTRFVESLFEMTGMSKTTSNPRTCRRPSEVLKSNKIVENIMEALTTQFVNPFDEDLDQSELYNLVSGCPVDDVSESLLNWEETGKERYRIFEVKSDSAEDLFDPIK